MSKARYDTLTGRTPVAGATSPSKEWTIVLHAKGPQTGNPDGFPGIGLMRNDDQTIAGIIPWPGDVSDPLATTRLKAFWNADSTVVALSFPAGRALLATQFYRVSELGLELLRYERSTAASGEAPTGSNGGFTFAGWVDTQTALLNDLVRGQRVRVRLATEETLAVIEAAVTDSAD